MVTHDVLPVPTSKNLLHNIILFSPKWAPEGKQSLKNQSYDCFFYLIFLVKKYILWNMFFEGGNRPPSWVNMAENGV